MSAPWRSQMLMLKLIERYRFSSLSVLPSVFKSTSKRLSSAIFKWVIFYFKIINSAWASESFRIF
jgi:hypothetical protein